LLRRDVDNAVDDLPVADQYDCEAEDQESGQTREGSAPPDCYPYIREIWSEYVLKFFESTRRPKNMQYQLLGDCKLCRASGSKKCVVYASTKTPSNFQRHLERNHSDEWKYILSRFSQPYQEILSDAQPKLLRNA
jgi:hypothetical protein